MTHLLGLTGSIGMGKSTTAQMFRDAGIPVWDADAVVHAVYAKGGAAVAPIAQLFPDAIVDDAVSRDALKQLLADDSSVLQPLVAQDRQQFLAANDVPLIVFDIPLLFETGADQWLSSVLVVSVPPDVQKARVLARPGMTEGQFDLILAKQIADTEQRARADHVIATLDLDETKEAVQKLIEKLTG